MRARLVLILPLLLGAWFMSGNFGLWVYDFIIWTILAAVIFSAVSLWIGMKYVRIEFLSNCQTCRRGENASVAVKAVNHSVIPFLRVRIHGFLPDSTAKSRVQAYTLTLPPKGEATCTFTVDTTHCGIYGLEKRTVRLIDPLGFFVLRIKHLPQAASVYVLPSVLDVGNLLPDGHQIVRPTQEHDELSDISPFVEGDAVSNVNWKKTMRHRELMADHYETAVNSGLCLLVDCRTDQNIDRLTTLKFGDIAGDYAITVLKQAIEEDRPVEILVLRGEGDTKQTRVETKLDRREAELLFASLRPLRTRTGESDSIMETFFLKSGAGGSACLITHQLHGAAGILERMFSLGMGVSLIPLQGGAGDISEKGILVHVPGKKE